ncbi:unnamed protein product [Lactuca saligna]|uniref:Uncharacterized protein n=1 Tax=Lactuca saligna TaxID=75948 RepID=A0AA35ZPQ4_LACSI|nr:unnamed protein product [Lactuca saligna]
MRRSQDAYEEKKAESQVKEVELPCEAGVGFKKRKDIIVMHGYLRILQDVFHIGMEKISQEMMKCSRSLFPNDDEYSKVLDDYAIFSMKSDPFEDLTNISKMATMKPKNLWVNFGAHTHFLQTLAFRLLGQPIFFLLC